MNPIFDIGNDTIDLRKVYRIGETFGVRSTWYKIYFINDAVIEVSVDKMKRSVLVDIWKKTAERQ